MLSEYQVISNQRFPGNSPNSHDPERVRFFQSSVTRYYRVSKHQVGSEVVPSAADRQPPEESRLPIRAENKRRRSISIFLRLSSQSQARCQPIVWKSRLRLSGHERCQVLSVYKPAPSPRSQVYNHLLRGVQAAGHICKAIYNGWVIPSEPQLSAEPARRATSHMLGPCIDTRGANNQTVSFVLAKRQRGQMKCDFSTSTKIYFLHLSAKKRNHMP